MNPSAALLYGKGIFTTIAIRDRQPLLWDKHWRRIYDNAKIVGIELSAYSHRETLDQLTKSLQNEGIVNGRARLTFFDESPSPIWPSDSPSKTSLHIITGNLRPVPDGFRLTVSPYPVNSRSPLAGVKSCNYLENLLAIEEAKTRGFQEAVRVNEHGFITGGCMSNVFWLKDEVLYTPKLATGCLPGTTREFVLENLECRESEVRIEELSKADAIFLTSAGLGITQVAEYEGKPMQRSGHPILKLLATTI
ncbi:MAG TPA: aminotransferase class IV [Pyrinomonadaceae bacterium]|nr:aminotransferase class IV [Pyrinomonadaceae bacterium]